jgi:hypothetical protein
LPAGASDAQKRLLELIESEQEEAAHRISAPRHTRGITPDARTRTA